LVRAPHVQEKGSVTIIVIATRAAHKLGYHEWSEEQYQPYYQGSKVKHYDRDDCRYEANDKRGYYQPESYFISSVSFWPAVFSACCARLICSFWASLCMRLAIFLSTNLLQSHVLQAVLLGFNH
jgi:hypothetical protein